VQSERRGLLRGGADFTLIHMPKHAGIGALLAVALVIRLVWGLMQPPEIDSRLPDQAEYVEIAWSFLRGDGLKFYDTRFYQNAYAYRMPGYPLFIAGMGGSIRVVRVAQAILDTSTILAAYLLARRWLSKSPSLVAAAFVAFNPFLIYFSALILTETLFTSLLVWGCVLLVWHPNFLWGGIVLALSILVRPSAVALPVLLGFISLFVNYTPGLIETTGRRWLRLPVGTTMILLTVLVLAPWAIRNKGKLGHFIWLTTNGGVTRYDGFHPGATGTSDQSFLRQPEMRYLRRYSEVERDAYLSQQAHLWIRETMHHDSQRLLRLTAMKIARTWSPIPLSAEFGSRRLYKIVASVYSIPLFALGVVGLWAARMPRSAKFFLLAPALYFTMIHAASVGSLRYRVPAEPLLAVLAAAGLMTLWGKISHARASDRAASAG
jgi:4-amino-4-deoxy-L-arabinose transferase-like glycosyltransferase